MRMLWRGHGRHRVEGFARGVEDGVDSCPDDPSTSRLVGLANALRSVPLRPSAELTLAFRRRIVNAARASRPEEPRPLLASLFAGVRLKQGLASTTALLTAGVALVSIGFGTTQALPGDTLYGLKLRGEGITIALARSDEARGYNYLQFAGARLRDVSGLIDHEGAWRESAVTTADREPSRHLAGLVNSTLTTMNGYTDKGASSLRLAYQRTGDPAPLAYLDDFTTKQHRTLSGMLGRLPAASQSVAGASLNLVDRLAKEASKLLTEQCNRALACQSQPRPSDETASRKPPKATPTEAPATSVASDITTSETPDPGKQPVSQGTSPQRVPSTSQQPPSTTTPTDQGSTSGSQPTTSPTPSTTDSGSSGGDNSTGDGSSTSGDTTDSASGQPSPPQPTGVPTTSSDRSTDASAGSSGSAGSEQSGGDTTPAADRSGSGSTGGTSGSTDGSGGSGSGSTGGTSGSTDGSGGSGGGTGGSGDASTPASRPSEPSDPSHTTASDPSGRSDPSGGSPDQTPSDRPSADSSTEATPAP